MKSDIIIMGSHAEIINKFRQHKLYTPTVSAADIFFIASLIGMYEGKIDEVDTLGNSKIEISRLYAVNKPDILRIISTFENLEDKYNGIDLTLSEIFMDEEKTNSKEKMQKIKDHAFYGLKKLEETYFNQETTLLNELDTILMIEQQLKTVKELSEFKVANEPVCELTFEELIEEEL